MKKVNLIIAALLFSGLAFAQTSKGSFMVGGDLGFYLMDKGETKTTIGTISTTQKNSAISGFYVRPAIGYFVSDDLAVGVALGIGNDGLYRVESTNGEESETVKMSTFGAGVFARKYFNATEKLRFFGGASFQFSTSNYTERRALSTPTGFEDGNANKMNSLMFGISPGLTYFPSAKWGIDFSFNNLLFFGTNNSTTEFKGTTDKIENKGTDFGINLGITPWLGLNYYFAK